MTNPRAETLELEKEKLWVTDAELIRRVGVPEKTMRSMLPALESKMGFPPKVPLFGGRRYWPAVVDYFDHYYGFRAAGRSVSSHGISRGHQPR
jgi:hypothetical protein